MNDPWKLIPLLLTLGSMALLAMGKISVEQMMVMLGIAQAAHSGISMVNNSPTASSKQDKSS